MQNRISHSSRILHAAAAVLLVVFASGCMDPKDRRPGLQLRGEVVENAIDDWSFSDAFQEVYLEAATSEPGARSVDAVNDWFWSQTAAAELLWDLRARLGEHVVLARKRELGSAGFAPRGCKDALLAELDLTHSLGSARLTP